MVYGFDGKKPDIGKNTYISDMARVIGDVVIGNNCYIGHGAILRGDYGRIEIDDATAVEEGAILHAPPADINSIGKMVTIGHGAVVHGKKIGDQAVIGMGAILSIGSQIGEWAIVAEGSVVKRKQVIPSKMVAAGNPARIIRETSEKDQRFWSSGKKLYIDLARKYLDLGLETIEYLH